MAEKCNHFKTEGHWTFDYDEETGDKIRVWEEREISACEDVSFTQYKCTKCGMVGNY